MECRKQIQKIGDNPWTTNILKYKDFLAKIAITESEFKRKYKEREYYSKMMRDFYKTIGYNEEELISGRSR